MARKRLSLAHRTRRGTMAFRRTTHIALILSMLLPVFPAAGDCGCGGHAEPDVELWQVSKSCAACCERTAVEGCSSEVTVCSTSDEKPCPCTGSATCLCGENCRCGVAKPQPAEPLQNFDTQAPTKLLRWLQPTRTSDWDAGDAQPLSACHSPSDLIVGYSAREICSRLCKFSL